MAALAEVGHPRFERPFGAMIPALHALVVQAWMHEHGAAPEHPAAMVMASRTHATCTPEGAVRKRFAVDGVLASRLIAEPRRLLNCRMARRRRSAPSSLVRSGGEVPCCEGMQIHAT